VERIYICARRAGDTGRAALRERTCALMLAQPQPAMGTFEKLGFLASASCLRVYIYVCLLASWSAGNDKAYDVNTKEKLCFVIEGI